MMSDKDGGQPSILDLVDHSFPAPSGPGPLSGMSPYEAYSYGHMCAIAEARRSHEIEMESAVDDARAQALADAAEYLCEWADTLPAGFCFQVKKAAEEIAGDRMRQYPGGCPRPRGGL